MTKSHRSRSPLENVKKSFPLNLFIEGSKVLVVGGGRVGLRKVESLLTSCAKIHLVCPDCVPELQELALQHRIVWSKRTFEPKDLEGCTLAFACTDSRAVNRSVLEVARTQAILCCCADGNWVDGDFTTPAMIRQGDLVVSVSTNGHSCQRAKAVKTFLQQTIASQGKLALGVIGISHEELSLRQLQQFLPNESLLEQQIVCLKACQGVQEFLIISTCNRFELIVLAQENLLETMLLQKIFGLPVESFQYRNEEAFQHLAEVVAGLRAQVLGESHIVAQVKQAILTAQTNGWLGAQLKSLFDLIFRTARQIRHVTSGSLEVNEIEQIALQWLAEKGIRPHCVGVIGTGQLGTAIVTLLRQQNIEVLWFYHEKIPPTSEGVRLLPLEAIDSLQLHPEVLIGAARRSKPFSFVIPDSVQLIDLGLPPNFAPECGAVGLDDLKLWYRQRQGVLDTLFETTSEAIAAVAPEFTQWLQGINGVLP